MVIFDAFEIGKDDPATEEGPPIDAGAQPMMRIVILGAPVRLAIAGPEIKRRIRMVRTCSAGACNVPKPQGRTPAR